ncbi:hypothetical protein NC651_031262 [Populus alba x Populus x berolinensis]|nr:hypothetical protein NC651_031262 [Populus alba x Populus x berolinensis]
MLSLLFLVLLTQANLSMSEQLPQNIFILAGQSNMAGRGGVVNNTKNGITSWDGIVPVQCQPNPSILRLSASLTWVQAHEPLHADIDYNKTNGVGPGMSFANAILTKVPDFGSIGLVPCAIGGTSISEWAKGGFLYDQLVRRTQFALQRGGVIRAMLWYQGESDTQIREDADAYKGRLDRFFIDLRADLGYPTLPIIQVALASGEGPYVEIVRNAQLGINLPNVQCVDAKGLPLEPDRVHLTTLAQVQLGQVLTDAFLQSLPSPIHIANNSCRRFSNLMFHFLIATVNCRTARMFQQSRRACLLNKNAMFKLLMLLLMFHSSLAANVFQDIFILAGQSNMAGRGGVEHGKWDGNVPPECRPNPSTLRLSAKLTWEEAHEPLHADIDVGKTCGVGPGMAFVDGLRANGSRIGVVGLVPCAVGGTKIRKWARGTQLYSQLVSRAGASVKDGGTIRAILWYQGESDTVTKEDADAYKGNMETLITNLRADLNIPSLPVIQVALASGEGKFIETVRSSQLAINLPNVKCIDAKGLALQRDNLHLTTMSQVQVGLKLAGAFMDSFGNMP